jgi:hypothetical protein
VRYLIDEDLPPTKAEVLRAHGIDAISTHEIGRNGLSDPEQLRFAAGQGRCLVTGNRNDFFELTLDFFDRDEPHTGVVVVPYSIPKEHYAAIADALIELAVDQPDGLVPYAAIYLQRARRS